MNATSTITGENNIKPKSAKTISNVRLITKSSAAHLEQRRSKGATSQLGLSIHFGMVQLAKDGRA